MIVPMRPVRGAVPALLLVVALVRCASAPHMPITGWVGDDAYRVAVVVPGVIREAGAGEGIPNMSRRDTLRAAVVAAREKVQSDFSAMRARRDGGAGAAQRAWLRITFDRELRSAISRGEVVHRRFHKDRSCEIVYQVELAGLRARVEGDGADAIPDVKNKKEAR